jgi:hypothetical protein
LAVAAAVILSLSFLIHELCSLDIWWQITIGKDILANGSIPNVDRFAAAALDRPYHDSHWIFQVALGLAHRLAGLVGVQCVMVGLWGATLSLCYLSIRRWIATGPAAILVCVVTLACVERFLPRPELVTFAGIACFFYLLQERRYRSYGGLAVLGLVQVLWANGHGLFVIGPFMVGCYWVVSAVAKARGDGPEFAVLSRAFVVVLVATLVTPFGFDGWRYAALLFTEVGTSATPVLQEVKELSGVFGAAARRSPAFWAFLALLTAAAVASASSLIRRRVSPGLLIVAGLGAAALTGRRNVVLFALVAAPFFAEWLARWPRATRPLRRGGAVAATVLILACCWFPLSGAYYRHMEIPARFGLGVTPSFFPHGLPAFLDEIGFEGQVLNSNTLGGFYLYHGYPERIPLTDGRWEIYDPDRLQRILNASRGPGDWRGLVREYDIRGILLAHTSPEAGALLPELQRAADWRLVYFDQAASFWMPASDPATPPPVSLDDPGLLPPPRRPDDGLILNAFLSGVDAPELKILNLERTLEFGVREPLILAQLGAAQMQTQRFGDAEATYAALLDLQPKNTAALNELAFLAYRRGDLERAAGLMRRLVGIEPGNESYRENLQRVTDAMERQQPATP